VSHSDRQVAYHRRRGRSVAAVAAIALGPDPKLVTLKMLANMTSGYPHFATDPRFGPERGLMRLVGSLSEAGEMTSLCGRARYPRSDSVAGLTHGRTAC
jgi:hypothetical protein